MIPAMATSSSYPGPECGTELAQLLGGGAIETFCPKCGFACRQTQMRATRPAERFWFRIVRALPDSAPDWKHRPGLQLT